MIVPIIIAAAALATRSVRGAAYVGCLPSGSVPAASSTTTGTDVNGCISFCSAASSPYAFYDNASGTCSCTGSSGSATAYQAAQDSGGSCAADQAAGYYLNTGFGFSICSSDITSNPAPGQEQMTNFVTTPDACYAQCTAFGGAAFTHVGGSYVCICSAVIIGPNPIPCPASGQQGFYVFGQAVDPEPTGGNARRHLKERLRRAQATKHQYCPSGFTGCIIGSDNEAFECVDTQSELESCGGCMNGLYGPTANNTLPSGVDCSAIPNVALGGVTCSRGQCVVSACQYGYALVGNKCERML